LIASPSAKRTLLDIIIVSDFRFPGGTSTAIAHEIRALSGAGYTIGLLQKRALVLKRDRDISSMT
jgi:hypothetical protein